MDRKTINKDYLSDKPHSFGGKKRVYEYYDNKSKSDIDKALSYNDIYTRFKQHRKSKKYSPIYVHKKRELFQSDVTFFTENNLVEANHGYKYLHCTIDVFTKMAWVYPMKANTCENTLICIKDILRKCGNKPERLNTDRGSEFKCREFNKFMEDNDIHHYFSYSIRKCPVVERFNLTIQQLVYKLMSTHNSFEWTKFLDQAMQIYLNRNHRTIQMTPIEAERDDNQAKLRLLYHQKYVKSGEKVKKPKYKLGNSVRIWKERGQFHRGYMEDYTREYFTIAEVLTNLPVPRYKLKELNGGDVIGSFFEDELVEYNSDPDLFHHIEKVIKERGKGGKKEYFVKFKGWSDSYNEWIRASNFGKI